MEPAKRSSHVAAAFHQLRQPALLLLLLLLIMVGALSGRSTADHALYPGDSLYTGQSLSMSSYVLIMQSDCNLVLYDGGTAVWSSRSHGRGSGCRATMQRDGNLVVYNGAGTAVWASNTARATGYYALNLQQDRNLVIYGPAIWATGTNTAGRKASITPKVAAGLTSSSSSHGAGVVGGGGRKVTAGGEGSKN